MNQNNAQPASWYQHQTPFLGPPLYRPPNIASQALYTQQEQVRFNLPWMSQLDRSIQQLLLQAERFVQNEMRSLSENNNIELQITITEITKKYKSLEEELHSRVRDGEEKRQRYEKNLREILQTAEERDRLGEEVHELREQNRILSGICRASKASNRVCISTIFKNRP